MALYTLVLVGGIGSGLAASKLPDLLKSDYVNADNSIYYQNKISKVVLYGTSTCGFCAKTRAYFKQHNIDYTDLDIEHSEQAKAEYAQLGGVGVPLILIGERRIQGFRASAISAALKKLAE